MAKSPTRVATPLRPAAVKFAGSMKSIFESAKESFEVLQIDISLIQANPVQARKLFDEESLAGLAESIERIGLQQPIIVRRSEGQEYVLIAGERRLRAHLLLGRPTILAIVTTSQDSEAISLIENVQRQDLNIAELAAGLLALKDNGGHSQREVAAIVGLSENQVGRTLAVLRIFELVPELLSDYQADPSIVSNSMMQELTMVGGADTLRSLWERAKLGKLSRSEVRNAVKREKLEKERAEKPKPEPTAAAIERKLAKRVERSMKTLETEIDSLAVVKSTLNDTQRNGLITLRSKIDQMLV